MSEKLNAKSEMVFNRGLNPFEFAMRNYTGSEAKLVVRLQINVNDQNATGYWARGSQVSLIVTDVNSNHVVEPKTEVEMTGTSIDKMTGASKSGHLDETAEFVIPKNCGVTLKGYVNPDNDQQTPKEFGILTVTLTT